MTNIATAEIDPVSLDLSTIKFTAEQFERLCEANPDRSFELTAQGVLVIMPPVGIESGNYESELGGQLFVWNDRSRLGKTFSSSTVFTLPNGSKKSPDAAWVELSRWEAVSRAERKKFAQLAPDFVIELRSETDRLPPLQAKMAEYRDNGVRLGWLINPQDRQVEIYRFDREVEVLAAPLMLSGEDVLPRFTLDLSLIWS
ncbi:Uma2 family endonuclease [Chamaesiphon sp. VAR_69_metabat_338]|uniref:Uma2 family endonuclease n=1 Tax=Chamaesiphon sp. VAR_69_metabat_338 TaxID=2964704 RepID=UPI00286E2A6B|nr:Uma2 family endonuclease [Chamaesiphon sp. VAR_69_metabat_338]